VHDKNIVGTRGPRVRTDGSASRPYPFSLEQFFCFFKKTFADGVGVFAAQFSKFLQFGFLFVVQARRNFDLNAHVQIAVAIALQIFHTVAFDPKGRARLRAGGDLYRCPAIKRGHFNFRAESRLDKTDRHFAEQVVAVALENFMRPDMQHDIKIGPVARRESRLRRCRRNAGANPRPPPAGCEV